MTNLIQSWIVLDDWALRVKDSRNNAQGGHKTSEKAAQNITKGKTIKNIVKMGYKSVDNVLERSRMHSSTPMRRVFKK